jgi:hypothetical protein
VVDRFSGGDPRIAPNPWFDSGWQVRRQPASGLICEASCAFLITYMRLQPARFIHQTADGGSGNSQRDTVEKLGLTGEDVLPELIDEHNVLVFLVYLYIKDPVPIRRD